jgi:hypothetical protein
MNKLLWTLTFLLSTPSAQAADPVLTNNATKKEIVLNAEAEKALKAWDAQFVLYKTEDFAPTVIELYKDDKEALPQAVLADFNGDKKIDLGLLGHNRSKEIAVMLLNQGGSYKVIVARTNDYKKPSSVHLPVGNKGTEEVGLMFYVGIEKAKDLVFKKGPGALSSRDGLLLETYGGDTRAYYLDKKNNLKEYKGLVE